MVDDYNNKNNNEEMSFGCADVKRSVPLVAVRWAVYEAFTNVELATLSKVSRSWREIVAQCIIDAVSPKGDKKKLLEQPPPSTFTRLLLPSIIRHFYASHSDFRSTPHQEEKQEEEVDETYCVAWFHPDGIKFKQLSLVNTTLETCDEDRDQDYDVHQIDSEVTTMKTVPDEKIEASRNDHKFLFTKSNSPLNQTSAASSLPMSSPARDNIMDWGGSILYQWDGYTEAIDVLGPFGYSNSLLRVSMFNKLFSVATLYRFTDSIDIPSCWFDLA